MPGVIAVSVCILICRSAKSGRVLDAPFCTEVAVLEHVKVRPTVHCGLGAIELVDGPWSTAGHHLTWWSATVTVNGGNTPVTYREGDVVVHGAEPRIYRATGDTTAEPGSGGAWTEVPRGTDDVRVKPGSTYEGYGVQ